MKTAISIPDAVFDEADDLARRTRLTRSGLYTRAVAEYVARHAPERVTEAMDLALADIGAQADPFVAVAARDVLSRSEW